MRTLIFVIPAFVITVVGLFFLLNVPVSFSDELKSDLVIASTFIVVSFGLIMLMIKVLKND
ncbi:MAG TPA: hypothetical protein VHP32_06345 [Ignavibacteria bacterium]|nr:hypothetical protein [Ignavibacteria bacterium]